MANTFFPTFNSQPTNQSKPLDPRLIDYFKQKSQFENVNAPMELKQNLAQNTLGNDIVVNPLDAQLHNLSNKSININSMLDYGRQTPTIEKKPMVAQEASKPPVNEKVKSYLQAKNGISKPSEPTKEETKKDDGKGFDWSYVMQGLGAIGESMKTGGGDQSSLAQNFQGMRDTRDAKEELAKFNDPNNETATEYRDFIKTNFNQKHLKDVDLNKMNLTQMQGMFGQLANRESADMQKQAMYAKMNATGNAKPNAKMADAESDVMSFKQDLRDYQKSVKDIGMLDLSGEGKANAETLRANLLLKLKNLEKTGALDAGMIEVAKGLLPEANYTRNGIVDTKVNSYANSIDRNFQNQLKATGYQPSVYKSDEDIKRNVESKQQNNEALQWAKSNPNDPRSKAILQKLGY